MPLKPFDEKLLFLNQSLLDDPEILSGQFWHELKIFLIVAKYESLSRASTEAKESVSTISRKIRRLQDQTKTQLFVTTSSSIKLTESGAQLYSRLSQFDQYIQRIICELAPQNSGDIKLSELWKELRIFLAVAKSRSLSAASLQLNASVPTISRKIRILQDQLGISLVKVSTTGVGLTAEGKTLALSIAALDYQVSTAIKEIKGTIKDIAGIVRVSATEGLSGVFIAANIVSFNNAFPGIELHLRSPLNLHDIRQNQTDILIGFQPTDTPDIQCTHLGTLHFVPIVSKRYVERHGMPSLADLGRHAIVDSPFYAAQTGLWEGWQKLTARARPAGSFDSSLAYGMAVRSGQGIGLLGTYILADSNFEYLDLGVHVRVPMYALALKERLDSMAVATVYDWMIELFGSHNPWFGPSLEVKHFPHAQLEETLNSVFRDFSDGGH